jgi:muramoyltetrapeptide carboxypeptidase
MLEAAILYSLRDFAGPVAIGLRSGHVEPPNLTVPLGVRVRLETGAAGNSRMDFLESAAAV